mgnify:CR=1 FL=1
MERENTFDFLPNINSPADLRKLPVADLPKVCDELRRNIINELADNLISLMQNNDLRRFFGKVRRLIPIA